MAKFLSFLFIIPWSIAQEFCLVSDNQQLQELFRAVNNTVGEVQENLDVDALISIVYDPEQPLAERNAQVERLNSLPESVRPLSFAEAARELCREDYYTGVRDRVENELRAFRSVQAILPPEARGMDANQIRSFLRENQDIYDSIGGVPGAYQYRDALTHGYGTLDPLTRSEEFIIIQLYTGPCYSSINRVLREADPYSLYRYMNLFATLNDLIEHLPVYNSGELRRWSTLPPEVLAEHTVGNIVRYAGVTSTTSRPDKGLSYFGCQQFNIEGGSSRILYQVSVNPGEREVIYPPGQCFLVTRRSEDNSRDNDYVRGVSCRGNAHIIHMRAVSCSTPPERERRQ